MKNKKKLRFIFTLILILLLLLYLLFYLVNYILDRRITNIYISGNYYLKDYEIISLAGLEDYPSNLKNSSKKISSNLENSIYILDAKVTKKFRKVYIEVKENRPLYYNKNTNKTVLSDKAETDNIYHVPTLLNYIPDTIIDNFIKSMNMLDIDILERISEIEYDPKDGDEYKFLLTMNDGNYVYLTLTGNSFKKLNSYPAMLKKFDGKKGILNLDYGNYLESYK